MLRSLHTRLLRRRHSRALAIALSALLPGCTISMPMLGSNDAPATTGSLAAPVQVEQPLPPSLAYSDAARIGQTAATALWDESGGPGEWLNAATGSSGTVEKSAAGESSETCRPFQTIVTSIGGVHAYFGRICREESGASVVSLAATGEETS